MYGRDDERLADATRDGSLPEREFTKRWKAGDLEKGAGNGNFTLAKSVRELPAQGPQHGVTKKKP